MLDEAEDKMFVHYYPAINVRTLKASCNFYSFFFHFCFAWCFRISFSIILHNMSQFLFNSILMCNINNEIALEKPFRFWFGSSAMNFELKQQMKIKMKIEQKIQKMLKFRIEQKRIFFHFIFDFFSLIFFIFV